LSAEQLFYILTGAWAIAMAANLIQAIRLCYRIESRSPHWRAKPGALPRYAAWLPVMLNYKVARDDETQAMRRRMNLHFAAAPVGFLVLYAIVYFLRGEV